MRAHRQIGTCGPSRGRFGLCYNVSIMLIVFTGNGKGKTTAALGQAMRAVGEGKRVLMIQFIKGPWKSGEDGVDIMPKGSPLTNSGTGGSYSPSEVGEIPYERFKLVKTGRGFVGIMGDTLPIEEHRKAAEKGFELAKGEIQSGNWDMIILDEINNAVHLGLISKEAVIELADQSTSKLEHLILTGRAAPQEFIERADLVTEMKDIKHPFEKGIRAKRGLEY